MNNNPVSKAFMIASGMAATASLSTAVAASYLASDIRCQTIMDAVSMSSAIIALVFLAMAYISSTDNNRMV